ncbi:MAG: hypothetical protein C0485_01805 [Pirellula sp.]|nr:hypothetical protein [Pirellula sp.]
MTSVRNNNFMKPPTTESESIAFWNGAGNELVSRINVASKRDDVVEAIQALMSRIVQSGNSLQCLYEANTHDWTWDGAVILRVIYDAMIQGLFILERDSDYRARRFLDFAVIEHRRAVQVIDAGETDMTRHLAASPNRAIAEANYKAEFDRLCKLYGINPDKKLPREWFKQSEPLPFQAEAIGYKSEYDFIYPQLCGATHSSYSAIRRGGRFPFSPELLVHFNQMFAYRLLSKLAEYMEVPSNEVQSGMVKIARRNVCDLMHL